MCERQPLVGASSTHVELYRRRDEPVGRFTYEVVRESAVPVDDPIFSDSFDA